MVVTVSIAVIVSIRIICRVFGHFSHRSEWQLVKVDYKSIFDRRCAEEDYRAWQLHSQVGGARVLGGRPRECWGKASHSREESGFSGQKCPSGGFLCVLGAMAVNKLNTYSCCEVIHVFIVLGYNEIKFRCAWLRLSTQNKTPTQHRELNIIYLSMSSGCRVWGQG